MGGEEKEELKMGSNCANVRHQVTDVHILRHSTINQGLMHPQVVHLTEVWKLTIEESEPSGQWDKT